MNLVNFSIAKEPALICLEVEGQVLDLHNFFNFEGVYQNLAERTVSLVWRDNGNSPVRFEANGFELYFEEVNYFEVTPRDIEIPDFGEDLCLDGMALLKGDESTEQLVADQSLAVWYPNSPLEYDHIWFAFRSGQRIRIGAKKANYRALSLDVTG